MLSKLVRLVTPEAFPDQPASAAARQSGAKDSDILSQVNTVHRLRLDAIVTLLSTWCYLDIWSHCHSVRP